jgi:glucosamine-6-phosphate deaminase
MFLEIQVSASYEEMSRQAAAFLLHAISQNRRLNIGLATGNTPTSMYKVLLQYLELGYSVDHVHFYNIDEYCHVTGKEPGTCRYYLEKNFYEKTEIPPSNVHWLDEGNYRSIEAELASQGGLDVIILGIGENGHIAYNEPNTAFTSSTHIVDLTDASKKQHSEEFGGYVNVPDQAVTMGVKTIMHTKTILLLASGEQKRDILHNALYGPVTEENPASVLQLHPQLFVFTDQAITN